MKNKFYIQIVLLSLFLLSSMAYSKDAYINDCSGDKLDYRTAKKACKSGDYAGQVIVTCSNKGKQKDKRTCNSDNERKGVYLETCAGTETDFTNLKKACQSENYFGSLLVKCKNGRVKKRMQCEAADQDDNKTVIFKTKCGSEESISGKNLKSACKANTGEMLVKCRRKGNVWKEKKSMFCQGKKDRTKFKKCSPTEREMLISDYKIAEEKVDIVLSDLENELEVNQDMDKKLRNKMEKVRKKLEKIQTEMDRPRTYICKSNKNLCKKAVAHTFPFGNVGGRVKICDDYFLKAEEMERVSIIVHEISHYKTQTNDKGTEHITNYSVSDPCANANLSLAANKFHKQAEYYEHIIECGLYIPE